MRDVIFFLRVTQITDTTIRRPTHSGIHSTVKFSWMYIDCLRFDFGSEGWVLGLGSCVAVNNTDDSDKSLRTLVQNHRSVAAAGAGCRSTSRRIIIRRPSHGRTGARAVRRRLAGRSTPTSQRAACLPASSFQAGFSFQYLECLLRSRLQFGMLRSARETEWVTKVSYMHAALELYGLLDFTN